MRQDDDFGQYVDTVNPPVNSSSELLGVKESILPQAAPVNAPIDNVLPGTSAGNSASPDISGEAQKTPQVTTSPSQGTISKGSPFTCFLLESGSRKFKHRGDKGQK